MTRVGMRLFSIIVSLAGATESPESVAQPVEENAAEKLPAEDQTAVDEQPSAEFLRFLGRYQTSDGEFVDPMQLESASLPGQQPMHSEDENAGDDHD